MAIKGALQARERFKRRKNKNKNKFKKNGVAGPSR
jgi:hypothetical protein